MKTVKYILVLFIGLIICHASAVAEQHAIEGTTESKIASVFGELPLHFVADKGQLGVAVAYYAKGESGNIICTEEGLILNFAEGSISVKLSEGKKVEPRARGELPGRLNYFIGNRPALWHTNIPAFREVVYRDAYPNIDLIYGGNQRYLKYTFHLHPSSELHQIEMIYEGIARIVLDKPTGELIIQTAWGEIRDAAPTAYQEIDGIRKATNISFRLIGKNRVGFAVEHYDPRFMLIIDPGYSTYLGGGGGDYGHDVAVDSSGDIYIIGMTGSSDFPSKNAHQSDYKHDDVFVTKFSSNGTLVYSTYLGGTGSEHENSYGSNSVSIIGSIAADSSGNVYITGITKSSDFPTVNAYQGNHSGGHHDAYVAALGKGGDTLIYSTYLGGNQTDSTHSIATDDSGRVYVSGVTTSNNFPTKNAYDDNIDGELDAFVTKIDTTQGSADSLVYSTFLGGDSNESANGIAVDSSGSAHVTGWTASANFPTAHAYQNKLHGQTDAFITKFSSSGSELLYSTYLGGSVGINNGEDNAFHIAIDKLEDVYITGWTGTIDFPTKNAYQEELRYPNSIDAFVAKLSNNGHTLIYSTYLGGSGSDFPHSIAIDRSGNAYIAGSTNSTNFPTMSAWQDRYSGGQFDAFMTKFSSSGSKLIYSTYLGGSQNDSAYGVAVDGSGDAYITGYTNSFDFPTVNAHQDKLAHDTDAFVVKLPTPTTGEPEDEEPTDDGIPTETRLHQNYPNPFTIETWIPYQLAEDSGVTIRIYNLTGELIQEFEQGHKSAGFYLKKSRAVHWDGRNESGEPVASGIYVYSMQAGDFSATRKMAVER